jgi:hypothetical protein
MTHHDTSTLAPAARRFRVSYSFVDLVAGDEDAIRKALRDVSFSRAFDPDDLDRWRVTRDADGRYLLAARRTLVDEVREPSARAALRRFLYHLDLPDDLDLASLRVEALPASDDDDPAPGMRLLPAPAEAA